MLGHNLLHSVREVLVCRLISIQTPQIFEDAADAVAAPHEPTYPVSVALALCTSPKRGICGS